ncbi:hypothetical protein MAPG_06332 [Magnaporthiopsis poae ATCC 64411]|uniref:Uncharacterized protein n=1 Tax=Magnaporthiopsis poae (strain ATCC 64411 / 73-15) TaxID=644358 RepID=A0A0C4E1R2_MAGP6|nr:hypothetical protein MAPG_06332 [Magnaporthiopsis poae ATCC 64411]
MVPSCPGPRSITHNPPARQPQARRLRRPSSGDAGEEKREMGLRVLGRRMTGELWLERLERHRHHWHMRALVRGAHSEEG